MISEGQFVFSMLGQYSSNADFEARLLAAARHLVGEIGFSQLPTDRDPD
jgi:hypothetical protein